MWGESQQGAIRRLVGPGPRFPTCTMKGWAKWSPGKFLKANGRLGGKGAFYGLRGPHPALQEGNRVGWGGAGAVPSAALHCGFPATELCPLSAPHFPPGTTCPGTSSPCGPHLRASASPALRPSLHWWLNCHQSGHPHLLLSGSLLPPLALTAPATLLWAQGGPGTQRPLKDPKAGLLRPEGCSPLSCEPQESPRPEYLPGGARPCTAFSPSHR